MSLNVILAHTNASVPIVKPVVDMGATLYVGSDCYPYYVKEVISDHEVILQAAMFRRTDHNGQSESQTYDIRPDPNGKLERVTLRKNGRWIPKGQKMGCGYNYLLGRAEAYSDPSL